jgi:hypothetical protein
LRNQLICDAYESCSKGRAKQRRLENAAAWIGTEIYFAFAPLLNCIRYEHEDGDRAIRLAIAECSALLRTYSKEQQAEIVRQECSFSS